MLKCRGVLRCVQEQRVADIIAQILILVRGLHLEFPVHIGPSRLGGACRLAFKRSTYRWEESERLLVCYKKSLFILAKHLSQNPLLLLHIAFATGRLPEITLAFFFLPKVITLGPFAVGSHLFWWMVVLGAC